jgi:hypothetical protein
MSKREERSQLNEDVYEYLRERAEEKKDRSAYSKGEKLTMDAASKLVFLDEFEKIATRVFKNKISTGKAPPKSKKKIDRVLNLIVSDTHFGSNLDPREVGHTYGPVEEARRMASVALQTANYKRQYRDTTKLNIFILGDIIQGKLHDLLDGATMAEQITRATYILVQMIDFLSKEFPNGIEIFCTSGNHERNTIRSKQRQTLQKFDSFATPIYTAIKLAFRHFQNIKVNIPYTPFIDYTVFGMRGFLSHGDTVFKIGYPGSNINVKGIKDQINTINAAYGKKGKEFDLFAFGHCHTSSMVRLPGAIMITNSCLLPTDPFAQSIGIFDCVCGQQLFETVPGHIVGDSRFIVVDEKDDKNKELDRIIKPFVAF